MRQAGLVGLPDHLRELFSTGDPLEVQGKVVDFEIFRAPLEAALGHSDGFERRPRGPMPANRRWAHASSMSSPTRRIVWACSSALSGKRGRGQDRPGQPRLQGPAPDLP